MWETIPFCYYIFLRFGKTFNAHIPHWRRKTERDNPQIFLRFVVHTIITINAQHEQCTINVSENEKKKRTIYYLK